MSVYIHPDLKIRIKQLDTPTAPRPLPLESGFSVDKSYEVLGLHCPSESGEAWLILRNDRDEMWFISNRHVTIVETAFELRLEQGSRVAESASP